MKLLVGLGNPGRGYDGTRHNIGFAVLEHLSQRAGDPGRRQRFQGEIAQATIRGCPVLLLWPLTWMNLSGGSVLAARDFYKVDARDILVICDDFQLPLKSIRLRSSGSAGGQKGLADILKRLGTEAIPRLRVGIGPIEPGRSHVDFVLGRFRADEHADLEAAITRAADAAETWSTVGIDAAMNRFN